MKKALLGAAAVVVLAAAGLVAYGLYRKHEGRNIRGASSVEFVTTQENKSKPNVSTPWPMYRFDASREGVPVGVPTDLRPPLRAKWFIRGKSLIEFPPAIGYGNLYFANSLGSLFAVKITRVRAEWVYRTGRCTAASPAVADHIVYMAFLNKPPCNATRSGLNGEVVALDAETGKVRWKVTMAPTESSPLVARDWELRLCVTRRLEPSRLRGLLRRDDLLLGRRDRRRALEVQDERVDLGLGSRDQRRRLRGELQRTDVRARRQDGEGALDLSARQVRGRGGRHGAALPRRLRPDLRLLPQEPQVESRGDERS